MDSPEWFVFTCLVSHTEGSSWAPGQCVNSLFILTPAPRIETQRLDRNDKREHRQNVKKRFSYTSLGKDGRFLVLVPQWACSDKTFIRVLTTVIKDMTLTLGECQKPSPAVAGPFICAIFPAAAPASVVYRIWFTALCLLLFTDFNW